MPDNIQIIYKTIKYSSLKVTPNLEIILTVPIGTRQSVIDITIAKRQEWVKRQITFFKAQQKIETKEYVSGENISYLGKNYRLKVIQSELEKIQLSGEFLQVCIQNREDVNRKKYLIDQWYQEKAQYYFTKIINKYIKIVNKPVNKVSIRRMKTRWGSCNPSKGYINLNPELIKKHISAIEYVIFHELTHLIHYNHDAKFYNYMTSHMPNWQTRKNKLLE